MSTKAADFVFRPQVWSDHINAYFDQKLGLASLALVDRSLVAEPGETKKFPYFKAIGAAQEPAEDEGLEVDKLSDDSFDVTVKEVGKAVGWKDKAIRVSATGPDSGKVVEEAQRQVARVFAEKVEIDVITAMGSSYTAGLVQTGATDTMNIRDLLKSKIIAFGDKADHATDLVMHSLDFMNLLSDSTAGFLHANALMPMFSRPGFMGQIPLLNMNVWVFDSIARASDIGGKKAYYHYFLKPQPFGIYMAADVKAESDRDILARETVIASTMWYGTLTLDKQVHSLDKRVGRGLFSTNVTA